MKCVFSALSTEERRAIKEMVVAGRVICADVVNLFADACGSDVPSRFSF